MSALGSFLESEIEQGNFPAAVALVGSAEGVLETSFAGCHSDTIFDLASLTKVLATAPAAALALSEGLSWDRPIGDYLADFKRTRFEEIRVRHLAAHVSGLPAWRPLYASGFGAEAYRRELARLEPDSRPGGSVVYSDLGTLVLGEILETVLAEPLDRVFAAEVVRGAGADARFGPIPAERDVAPTEEGNRYEKALCESLGFRFDGFRSAVIRGEVHDGNAYYRGGVAAHAGLFGTAEDVWKLARPWLSVQPEFRSDQTPELPESRGLLWQRKRGAGSAVEEFGEGSFGHTGFTGTSVWLDPDRDRIFVLLTNRVHPEVQAVDFNAVRRRFHRAAIDLGI